MSTIAIPPTYKSAVGLAIMVVVLLVRPHGLLGSRA
jgi:branched-subunit amino acid ABC-type transport system permease component